MDKEKYIVSNTCAFDSLAQIFASSVIDSNKYAKYFESIQNDVFLHISKDIAEAKINQITYRNRVQLLKTLRKTQLQYNLDKSSLKGPNIFDDLCGVTT